MIKCQCAFCLHFMGVPDALSGKKILCPLCHDPMVVPAADAPFRLQPFDLKAALGKIQWSEWDRAFASRLLESGRMEEKALHRAIGDFAKEKKGHDRSFPDFLLEHGLLPRDEAQALREQLRGSVQEAKAATIECANCFANIPSTERACRFCGQRVGDPALDTCPRCKHEQKKGMPVCVSCGANLKTGVHEGVSRCPACQKLVIGSPDQCPHCKVKLRGRQERRQALHAKESGRRLLRFALAGAAAAVVLLLLLLRGPIGYALRASSVGWAQAGLERQAEEFGAALVRGWAEAKPLCASGADGDLGEVLFGPGAPKVKSVRGVTLVEAAIGADGTGSVSAAVRYLPAGEADPVAALGRPETRGAEWRFRKEGGEWRFAGMGK